MTHSMIKHRYRKMFVSLFCIASVFQATPAYAYLDPMTGSLILQMLVGGVAGVAVVVKLYWQRVKGFFKRSPSNPKDESIEP